MGSCKWLFRYCGFVTILFAVYSCKSYQANVLFVVEEEDMEKLSNVVVAINENYVIRANDQLQIEVYTNKGEELVDPNNALDNNIDSNQEPAPPVYLIQSDGTAELPIIGNVELGGLTLFQVNSFLTEKYKEYYRDPFVQTKYLNKRVIILGGTEGKVIPLENEGMNLLEVLALAGGIDNDSRGNNIRLIRGDLNNPQVQVIDLTTIEGMTRANLEIQPNDIIYIEPIRRPLTEGLRDVVPILSLLTSVLALVVAFSY